MSDGTPDDDPYDESNSDPDDDRSGLPDGDRSGPIDDESGDGEGGGWLSNLVTALERLDRLSESDDRPGRRTSFDYDVSIGNLDDLSDRRDADRHDRERGFDSSNRRERRSLGGRSGGRRSRSRSGGSRYNVTTQAYDDEVVITADVSGIDRDDVTVGFDGGRVVVGVAGSEIERVRPPWDETTADATVRNGVLTVTIAEADDE